MRGNLLADHWLQSIHECSKSVNHRHGWNPQLEATEVLDVVLYRASLAQSLQLLPCLLLLSDSRECCSYLPSELPLICLSPPWILVFSTLNQLLAPFSNLVLIMLSAWEQLQLVCGLFQLVLDSGESFPSELRWGFQFHIPTSSSHCWYRPQCSTTPTWRQWWWYLDETS